VLSDGTVVRPGARVGILHLNNERVTTLAHDDELSGRPGLRLRRDMVASLAALARRCASDRRLLDVHAFSATTIFHRGLQRLGFEECASGLAWPRLVGGYQRALLVTLRRGAVTRRRPSHRQARQLWISRKTLLSRYGSADESSTEVQD
jgi:hypothetical protein